MTNSNVLRSIISILENVMFSKTIPLGFADITYNESDTTAFWNYVLSDDILNDNQIQLVESSFLELNRKSTIYFEYSPDKDSYIQHLAGQGYKINNDDSWMFYTGTKAHIDDTGVKIVSSVSDLQLWLETLNGSYRPDDPNNPYGELGGYVDLVGKAWQKNHGTANFDYILASKDDQPVAVATISYQDNLAYISNVGSLPSVRGQGYGKLVTLYCVQQAQQRGVTDICLATEENTYPNEFYSRIGFETRFTARGYTK